jgi:hypothetical protein
MSSAPAPAFVTMRFKKVVGLGLTAQAINFAQSEFMGHRVRFSVPVDYMNQYFTWERAAGDFRPTGRFDATGAANAGSNPAPPEFSDLLKWCLGSAYSDIDGVADGLNYSSTALNTYNELKRDESIANHDNVEGTGALTGTHYSANDLVMAYVLFKCFGSSAVDTSEIVYNLEDAFGMLTSESLADAIESSLTVEDGLADGVLSGPTPRSGNRGKVDDMLRALLAADPQRFFKDGTQLPGLFETNTDASGSGNWCLKAGDIIEVPIKLFFRSPVTVLSVVDNAKQPSSLTPENPETVVIEGEASTHSETDLSGVKRENIISIRLQLQCSTPDNSGGLTYASNYSAPAVDAEAAQAAIITRMNVVFYNGPNYAASQSAIVVVASGPELTYDVSGTLPDGVEINSATGVLTFTRAAVGETPVPNGRFPATILVTSGATDAVEAAIVVSIDDGSGASNSLPA